MDLLKLAEWLETNECFHDDGGGPWVGVPERLAAAAAACRELLDWRENSEDTALDVLRRTTDEKLKACGE